MKKRTLKLMAVAMVFALIFAFAALPASAATTYTAVEGTSTQFNKYLVVDSDTNIPNKTFGFSIAPGTPISASDGKVAVIAGPVVGSGGNITSPSITDVTFAPTDETNNGLPSDPAGTPTAGKKYATQTAIVDFTGVTFPEPGVYRYTVRENAVSDPYQIDSTNPLTLDVYVVDNEGDLEVSEYVLHSGTAAPTANNDSGTADVPSDGNALSDKKDGFTNVYETKDLGISKMVSGNQASKDKYFAVTVNITGLTAGDTYDVILNDADATINASPNEATTVITNNVTQPNKLTVAAGQTSITQVYYLQHDQSITIQGLPSTASYTVTENKEDYTETDTNTKVAVRAQGTQEALLYDDATNGTMTNDTYVGFTNTKDGVIPTGVLLTIAPFAIGLLLFGALAVFLIARKKRKAEDE